jgi:hypothetical protein
MVDRVESLTLTNVSGISDISVGVNAGGSPPYNDLLARVRCPGIGDAPLGKAASSLGSSMSTDGMAYYGAAETVVFANQVSGSALTAGRVRVRLIGRYLGE